MQKHLPIPVYDYVSRVNSGILPCTTGVVKLPGVIDDDDDRHWGLVLVFRPLHEWPVLMTIPIVIHERLSVEVRTLPRAEVVKALRAATEFMAERDVMYHTILERGRQHIVRLLAEIEEAKREVCAAGVIRAAWLEANSNPSYAVCQRRLRREFAGLEQTL